MSSSESDLSCPVPPVNAKIMARKRGRASVVKDGEEGQEIKDIVEKGDDDDDSVVGDIDQDSDDDFIVDPKIRKKKSKSKIGKSIKSSVVENPSQVPETSVQEFNTLSTSPMVIIKTCNEDFFELMTKPESDYNSNQRVERPKSVSTPEQTKSPSIDEEEKFSTPVSTPAEGSCDKLVQRLVCDLLRFSKTPPTVSPNADLVPMIPKTIPPRLEALAGVTISQPASNQHLLPVPSPKTTPARFPSGGGNLTRPVQLHNPGGQARQADRGPRPPIIRPGAPRMMRPVRPPGLDSPRPRATNPLEGPRPTATPRLVNVRSLAPASHSSMATPQPPSQSRYIHPVVDLELSPDRTDHDQYPASPPGSEWSEQMSPSLPCSSVVDKLSSLGVSLAQVKSAVTHTKHVGMLPPGISITRITPSREESPSLSLPGLANALIHLGKAEGRRRMVQYDLTEGQVKALRDLGVKEVARI